MTFHSSPLFLASLLRYHKCLGEAKGAKEVVLKRQDGSKSRPETAKQTDRVDNSINTTEVAGLRIVGGRFRGRKLLYSGDIRTRPMKDRLREAVFNLVGTDIKNAHAIDLFAGTGALGLEALSRGAVRATFIEQHYPTAAIIKQNIATLEVSAATEIVPGNTFIWFRRHPQLSNDPWVVFCSPPYAFYLDREAEMLELIEGMMTIAPPKSVFVVEADDKFDFKLLPLPNDWDVRVYQPAVVGVFRKIVV
jgi:16S rRNA (guanine966-N2)-methyltransferase